MVRGDEVSAEKGYLKETGNLIFHTSMVVVLLGVALGSWYGWQGNRLLVAGEDRVFCNTRQQYAEIKLGPRVGDDLPRFCMQLDEFDARFLPTGQPSSYRAKVTVDENGGAPGRRSSRSTRRCAWTGRTSTCWGTGTPR